MAATGSTSASTWPKQACAAATVSMHPTGAHWRTGEGMAVAMIATMAPRGHIAKTTITLRPDGRYILGVGTSEFGNGTTTVHTQIVSTVMGTGVDRIELTNSDTDGAVYDTGAFASAGTTVAGKALHGAALKLRGILLATAAGHHRRRSTASSRWNGTACGPARDC